MFLGIQFQKYTSEPMLYTSLPDRVIGVIYFYLLLFSQKTNINLLFLVNLLQLLEIPIIILRRGLRLESKFMMVLLMVRIQIVLPS